MKVALPLMFGNRKNFNRIIRIILLFVLSLYTTTTYFSASAATYTLTTTNAAEKIASWAGSPPNFTTSGDIFIISSGQTAIFANIIFGAGVTLQINSGGIIEIGSNRIMTINGTIDFQGTVSQVTFKSGSNLTIASGALVKTANPNGLYAATGNASIITATPANITFNAAANYEFNDAAQATTGLPATVANLTLSGSGAKTLTTTTTSITGNLTLSGTASTTTVVDLTVGGNLLVGDGTNAATLTAAAFTLSVTGTTTVANTSTLAISSATGTKTFTGAVTINAGGTISESAAATLSFGNNVTITGILTEFGAATVEIAGSLTNNGTYTASTGVHTFSGTGQTIGGTTTNTIPTATFTGTYTNSGTLTCATLLTITTVALTNTGTINSATSLTGTGTLANTAGTVNITAGTIGINTNTNSGTFAINSTATSTTAVANFTNTGTVNITGSGTIAGITNNAAGIVNHSGSSTVTSFNNATATSTLNISSTPTVPTFTTLTITTAGNTVNYNATGSQTLIATTYSNLTISGTGTNAKTAGGDITVNGILNLTSENASSSAGALEMSTYTLTMGATATTTGTGDVTGKITRSTFVTTTPYTFGNRYTTITITSGTTPTNITVKIVLTTSHTWKSNAIHRYLDIIRTGGASDSRISLSMHYLTSELNSIAEENIDFFDYIISTNTALEHGHSNKNFTEHWYELANLSLYYVAETSFDTKYWTLAQGDTSKNVTWISGSLADKTDWTLADNWIGGVPDSTSNVIIPSVTVSGTIDNPTLPSTASVYTIRILSGGVLNATTGSPVLTITDGVGAWNNSGTFNPGTSTVIFTSADATMADPTTFYNITIAAGASLSLGTDNVLKIGGTFTNNGTLYALNVHNTVEYNGSGPQTIASPDGITSGYHNLVLSGSGTKTFPSSTINIAGDFTNNGTMASGSGTLNFYGTSLQTINGSSSSNFNNLTLNNAAGLALGTSTTVSGTLTLTSGKFAIGAYTLTLGGAFSGSATNSLTGSASSNIVSSGTTGNVYFDQTTPGTTNLVKNLTINGNTTTLGNALNITAGASPGLVTINSGTLESGGFLTLKSDASGTANIGTSAGSISGNINVERYVSGQGRKWRFFSSPVSGNTIGNWMTQFYVTGPGTGSVLGDPNSNGWHTNNANIISAVVTTTSIRTYNETDTTGDLNTGWLNVSTTQSLAKGVGYRTYIRGPIGNTAQIGADANNQSSLGTAFTLSLTGGVTNTNNAGNITMPVTFSSSGTLANDGWNLLGNPYPSAYDWNSFYDDGGTTKTNIDNTIYIFDATANAYKSYNASSGGTLTNGIIPSGAGFFVQAIASSPSLIFTEAFKSTTAPIALHKGSKTDEFTIKYSKDSTENDEYMLKMMEGATMNKESYDIYKLRNENLNLSSYGNDSLQLTLSAIPFVTAETHIKLNVEATQVGNYQFEFKNMENFDAGVSVSLLDNYTNTMTDVKKNTKYSFDMGAGVNQWGKNRFELILNGKATNITNDQLKNETTTLSVYPNPATDILNININNANFKNSSLSIYDITGKQIITTNMNGANAQINIEGLSNGVYFLNVNNKNGYDVKVKFVK